MWYQRQKKLHVLSCAKSPSWNQCTGTSPRPSTTARCWPEIIRMGFNKRSQITMKSSHHQTNVHRYSVLVLHFHIVAHAVCLYITYTSASGQMMICDWHPKQVHTSTSTVRMNMSQTIRHLSRGEWTSRIHITNAWYCSSIPKQYVIIVSTTMQHLMFPSHPSHQDTLRPTPCSIARKGHPHGTWWAWCHCRKSEVIFDSTAVFPFPFPIAHVCSWLFQSFTWHLANKLIAFTSAKQITANLIGPTHWSCFCHAPVLNESRSHRKIRPIPCCPVTHHRRCSIPSSLMYWYLGASNICTYLCQCLKWWNMIEAIYWYFHGQTMEISVRRVAGSAQCSAAHPWEATGSCAEAPRFSWGPVALFQTTSENPHV